MSIVIRFTRDNCSLNDDILCIKPNSLTDNSVIDYSLTMKYADIQNGTNMPKSHTLNLSSFNLYKYINSLFVLISNDKYPFLNIQIDAPNYPTVLLTPSLLGTSDVLDAINNMLDVIITSWPVSAQRTV